MAESRIQIANDQMSIGAACRMIDMDIPDLSYAGSMKLHCPFGEVSHADGGQGKAFKIYPSDNTAYCFACAKFFNPVKLVAMARDLTEEEAAEVILEKEGYKPEDLDDQWSALVATPVASVNHQELAEALKIFCARVNPSWEERQFDTAIADRFQACLDLLPGVTNGADSEKWLSATKQVMATTLGD